MRHYRSILIASISVTIAALAFAGLDIADIWDDWSSHAMGVVHDSAIIFGVAAALAWITLFAVRHSDRRLRWLNAEYRRREAALVRMADMVGKAPTKPFPVS